MNPFIRRLMGLRSKSTPTPPRKQKATRRPKPTVLHIDTLEDRAVPATFTVNALTDTGTGSGVLGDLRYCLTQANSTVGTDTINFDPTLFFTPQTINLGSGLTISDAVIIQGPLNPVTQLPRATISGTNTFALFTSTAASVTMSNLTLTGGRAQFGGAFDQTSSGATIAFDHMRFTGNAAAGSGGAVLAVGCFVSLTSSTVANNTAAADGGGLALANGSLVVKNSTISGNTTTTVPTGGYDYFGGGGIYFYGTPSATPPAGFTANALVIQNSTIANNNAKGSGGGIDLVEFNGILRVQESTISGNTAQSNAIGTYGSYGGGGIGSVPNYFAAAGSGSIQLTNSIVSGNNNTNGPDILTPGVVSANFSAIGNTTGITPALLTGGNNVPAGTNLNLGPLANNGGPTQTMLPGAGSPLINTGSNAAIPVGTTTDQRGTGYTRSVGPLPPPPPAAQIGPVDIGAVEVQAAAAIILLTPTSLPVQAGPTNATTITFTALFSQPMTGVTNANFILGPGTSGVTTNPSSTWTVAPASGFTPDTAWTITVTGISGNGNLQIELSNPGGISPAFLGGPMNSSPVVAIDQTPPVVNPLAGSPAGYVITGTNPVPFPGPQTATYQVNFSEPVTGVTAASFTPVYTGTVNGGTVTTVTPVSPTLIFGVTYATQWNVTITGFTGDGTLALKLSAAPGIKDQAGNTAVTPGPTAPPYSVGRPVVDIVPTVLYTNATSVTFNVNFNRSMTGVNFANFAIGTTGSVTTSPLTAASLTGSGSSYVVTVTGVAGEGTVTLSMTNATGVSPSPLANLPFTGPAVTIDHTQPTISSITPSNPASTATPTNATSVVFAVAFADTGSGAVTGVDGGTGGYGTVGDFVITGSGLTGPFTVTTAPSGSPSGSVWLVTVTTGGGQGTLGLELAPTAVITDLAGNPLSNTISDDPTYTVDHVVPTVTSIVLADPTPTNATTLHYTVTFSEPVVGLDITNFGVVTGGGTFTATPTVTAVTGSGSVWSVTVSIPTDTTPAAGGTARLDLVNSTGLADTAGNPVTVPFTGGSSYFVDTTLPLVSSIVPTAPLLTNASSVTFTVTFSEPVVNVDQSTFANFTLTGPGATGASITSIAGSGSTYTVTVQTGADGTLGLSLSNIGSVTDVLTNPLAATAAGATTFTVDRTPPVVTSILPVGSVNTNASPVSFTVTFSEPVAGLDTSTFSNFTIDADPSIQTASIIGVTPVGTAPTAQWTVTVGTGIGEGKLAIDLTNAGAIQDPAGNALFGLFNGTPFVIDHTPPKVVSLAPAVAATHSATVDFNVHFSEAVTGLDPTGADFALIPSGVSGASITGVAGSGADWVVTVNTGTGDGTLEVDLAFPGTIQDLATNPLATSTFTGQPVTVDKTPPGAIVTPAPGQLSPANTLPLRFIVVFSEPVTGFGPGGLVLGGTVSPSSVVVSGGGTTYTVTLDGFPASGTVTVNTAVGAATDPAGNPSSPTSGPAAVTYSRPVPTKADFYTTAARVTLTVDAAHGVSANDGDAVTPAGSVQLASAPDPSVGTVKLNPDGSFVFTPAAGFTGSAVFTYTSTDDGVTFSQPVPVTITVNGRTTYSAEAPGAGGGPVVNVLDANGKIVRTFFAYAPDFTGGVQVAVGDVNGDGVDDIIVGTGVGGGPNVKVFDGATGALLASFFAYEDSFRGGVQVAAADLNGDGRAEVITGTGVGGGPRVRVFDLSSGKPVPIYDFMAYADDFRGGVMVAGGDVDGDGKAELLVGAGPGGGPHVKVYRMPNLQVIESFYAFDPSFGGGVSIAVGDVGGDGKPEIIVGATSGAQVRAFSGTTGAPVADIPFTFPQPTGGVRVATQDTNNDGNGDLLLMATGPGDPPRVVRVNLNNLTVVDELLDYPQDFRGGLYVG
jgi:hypothetical protein